MIQSVEPIVDGIVAMIKADLPALLVAVDAEFAAPDKITLGMPRDSSYYITDWFHIEEWPALNVFPIETAKGDQNQEYEWNETPVELQWWDSSEDLEKVTRKIWRTMRALEQLFADNTNLDGYAVGITNCIIESVEWMPTFKLKEGQVPFVKGARALLVVQVEETR